MIEKSLIFYVIYLNHVHILKSFIFQEVLNILYFKIIPTISQNFDSNFWEPKLAHTLYSPFMTVPRGSVSCTGAWANVLQSEFGGNAESCTD